MRIEFAGVLVLAVALLYASHRAYERAEAQCTATGGRMERQYQTFTCRRPQGK